MCKWLYGGDRLDFFEAGSSVNTCPLATHGENTLLGLK